MIWTRAETLPLARRTCPRCHGYGMAAGPGSNHAAIREDVCSCVLREIFRSCNARYIEVGCSVELLAMEFRADFCIIARNTLNKLEHSVFDAHFLAGGSWRKCCAALGLSRGDYFHGVYRIERKLGRAYRETEPYPLFPTTEYFGSPRRLNLRLIASDAPIPEDLPARSVRQIRSGYPAAWPGSAA